MGAQRCDGGTACDGGSEPRPTLGASLHPSPLTYFMVVHDGAVVDPTRLVETCVADEALDLEGSHGIRARARGVRWSPQAKKRQGTLLARTWAALSPAMFPWNWVD